MHCEDNIGFMSCLKRINADFIGIHKRNKSSKANSRDISLSLNLILLFPIFRGEAT